MAGSLRERQPGVWQLRVAAGADPSRPGQSLIVTRTFRTKSKREAEKALAALIVEVAGTTGTPGTVQNLLHRWMTHAADRGRSGSTLRNNESHIRRWILPTLGEVELSKLTAQHLDRLYSQMQTDGAGPHTIRIVHSIIRAALRQAEKWDMVPRNVAQRATMPSVGQQEAAVPTNDEIAALLASAETLGPSTHVLVALAAATGARRGELAALRWSDTDLEQGVARIAEALDVDGTRKSTKTRSVRTVTLPAATVALLRAERARQAAVADSGRLSWPPDAPVLCTWPGAAPHKDTLSDWFRQVRDHAGVRDAIHLHSLRHWQATTLLAAGVDATTVGARLGHADGGITARRVYAHRVAEADQRAAAIVDQLLGAGP